MGRCQVWVGVRFSILEKGDEKVKKITLYLMLVVGLLLLNALPAFADGPGNVYVDPSYDGNEEGSQEKPYNTEDEGRAYLQSMPDGGFLYVRNEDGTWSTESVYVAAVASGATGEPLPQSTLYTLLATLALGLIVVGWQLLRRARRIGDRAY